MRTCNLCWNDIRDDTFYVLHRKERVEVTKEITLRERIICTECLKKVSPNLQRLIDKSPEI